MSKNAESPIRRLSRRQLITGISGLPLLALVGCCDGEEGEPASSGLYFPPPDGDWERIPPEEAGYTSAGIDSIIELARANRTTTLVLISGGRILAESYFGEVNAATTKDVASVQKSVTSALVGIAAENGLLTLDDAVSQYLPPGWSNADSSVEDAITIRHLITHSSGLQPRTMVSVAAPGTKFDYNTAAYQRLCPLLQTRLMRKSTQSHANGSLTKLAPQKPRLGNPVWMKPTPRPRCLGVFG